MKNNMKIMAVAAGALSLALVCPQAHADSEFIAGSYISFNGSYEADGSGAGDLIGANYITSINALLTPGVGDPSVLAGTGSFVGAIGGDATFNTPISLNAENYSPAGQLLWQVATADGDYDFYNLANAAAAQTSSGNSASDTLSGYGYATFTDTLDASLDLGPSSGTWTLTVGGSGSSPDASFAFTGSSITVPDGSLTMILLGSAFGGIAVLRRKLA